MKITPNKIVLTAALFLALLVGYVQWAQTRCQSTLTATGLPCPRAPLGPDRFCAIHQPMQKAYIDHLLHQLVERGK